jgi:hypothetical protein
VRVNLPKIVGFLCRSFYKIRGMVYTGFNRGYNIYEERAALTENVAGNGVTDIEYGS